MPEVHRGYFDVKALDDQNFRLSHASPDFAKAEAKDVSLSEITLPFPLDQNNAIDREFGRMAEELPAIDWTFVAKFVAVNTYKSSPDGGSRRHHRCQHPPNVRF